MRGKLVIELESATLKRLLAGMVQIENALPYNGDGFEVRVIDIVLGLTPGVFEVYANRVDEERKIASIKSVRGVTGMGLKEAKDAVELCISTSAPILLGRFPSKIEAVQCMQLADQYGSIYDTYIKGVDREV